MKNIIQIISAVAFLAIFIGCATLSKNECLEADWFEIGRRDGNMGKQRSIFRDHYDACLEYQVHADRQAYYKGREESLKFFCTKQTGFELGRRGRSYRYVCPPALESEFLSGYAKGRELYKYEKKVVALEKSLASIENQIQEKEKLLSSIILDDEQRVEIRTELKYLDIEHREIIRKLKNLEETKPIAQME